MKHQQQQRNQRQQQQQTNQRQQQQQTNQMRPKKKKNKSSEKSEESDVDNDLENENNNDPMMIDDMNNYDLQVNDDQFDDQFDSFDENDDSFDEFGQNNKVNDNKNRNHNNNRNFTKKHRKKKHKVSIFDEEDQKLQPLPTNWNIEFETAGFANNPYKNWTKNDFISLWKHKKVYKPEQKRYEDIPNKKGKAFCRNQTWDYLNRWDFWYNGWMDDTGKYYISEHFYLFGTYHKSLV